MYQLNTKQWLSSLLLASVSLSLSVQATAQSSGQTDGKAATSLTSLFTDRFAHANTDLCAGVPTHQDNLLIKKLRKPPFMKRYREPAFGTTVMRITDSRPNEVYKPLYSTIQAWNADESLLILFHRTENDASHLILDGTTYEVLRRLDIEPADLEEVFWSHTDPDKFYYVNKYSKGIGEFREYSYKADSHRVIRKFEQICGARGVPTAGGDVHQQSLDDDLFGFRCRVNNSDWSMFSYQRSTDTVITRAMGEDRSPWHPWAAPTPAPSGKRFWLQGAVVDTDLQTVNRKLDMNKDSEHSSTGQTHDGQDALYQVAFGASPRGCDGGRDKGIGHLVEHNLETGECRTIIGESGGYPYPTSGTHISARAYKAPGWVALSSIGYEQDELLTGKRKAPVLYSEIYLANTDPDNGEICRVAQHRSYGKNAKNGNYNPYFGEPHVTISPSGTRLLFGSDWHDSGSVDTYIVELPAYRRHQ